MVERLSKTKDPESANGERALTYCLASIKVVGLVYVRRQKTRNRKIVEVTDSCFFFKKNYLIQKISGNDQNLWNKIGIRRLKKRLVCEAEEWLDHGVIVNQVKKIKKASPPDYDYIIVNCLVEAFNRVHSECEISMDITPRIIKKKDTGLEQLLRERGQNVCHQSTNSQHDLIHFYGRWPHEKIKKSHEMIRKTYK